MTLKDINHMQVELSILLCPLISLVHITSILTAE
uniref:Uncharacterized protein n=1 Tax=Rhizophora mucronata TaxID=61149 RepID=A0A2P2N5T4_RHIMU